jgi:hypothetical protein
MCRNNGFNKICFNKYTGLYKGCGISTYNDCTVNNTSADQNIWCDVQSVTTTTTASTTTTIPIIKFTCNPSTWQCAATYGGGEYDSLSTCQARCQDPTTTTISPTYPCAWCGSDCTRVAPGTMCPTVIHPQGYSCVEINGQCTMTNSLFPSFPIINSISGILDKLSASLISVLESLKK